VKKSRPLSSPDAKTQWTIFWIALAVRLLYMTLARMWHMRPYDDHFAFGYEMGRVARALDTGYGFADPFRGHTGPTAWVPPLYPWILAADFRLFGIYSALSAWVILALDSLLNALMIFTTWEIARRCFNRKVALWAAWLWALYPAAMQYAVKWVWEMTLSAFLFSWVFVLVLRMRPTPGNRTGGAPCNGRSIQARSWPGWARAVGSSGPEGFSGTGFPGLRQWSVFGLLWGLIALTNPSLLLFLPVCTMWILLGFDRRTWPRQIVFATLAAVIVIACVAPWTWRNWKVFHAWVPLRGNLGAELYLGNGPGATGLLMEYDHPAQDPLQLRLYKKMGEAAYVRMRGAMAKKIIRADPKRFILLSLRRFYYFWFSVPHPGDEGFLNEYGRNLNYQFTSLVGLLGLALALRRRAPAAWLFFWAFLLLPLTYYMVTVHARFRHPLEPLITILGVYLFQSAEKS
jgi:4-amino-4-deoxy-L-arabinose transferase-like glycosyltransferase